ncbi:MAG TPA: histidinol-phosphate transaminase [Dehalococcoidia bacterium]|nr:histidinol-phosphate transaminase [Dehalococcoidia bacterium]
MSLLPRPEIQGAARCLHGGIDYVELETQGITPQDILDFSANLNPFGPPPGVMEAVNEVDISHYPDSEASYLRRSLAEKLGIKAENILVSSGSTELIRLAALAYFGNGDRVLIIEPTYGEYQVACQISGASLVKQHLSSQNGFWLNTTETVELIRQHCPKGIFVCNPNNPTGRYLSQAAFERILDAGKNSLIVLDEAYVSFVDNAWSSLDLALHSSLQVERSNLLVLRSMTKDYAMPGLRLGYGVARGKIIANLRRICPPWNVNTLAQKAGTIAIAKEEYLKQCQVELKEAKDYLKVALLGLGLPPLPSEANFFLVEVGNASRFRRELLKRKILVRDCTSFGLPQYIRIASRTLPECQRLVATIKETLMVINQGTEHNIEEVKQTQAKWMTEG